MRQIRLALGLVLFTSFSAPHFLFADEPVPANIATYPEIPYYVRQLEQATLESKRMQHVKTIHDAVVYADLTDKRVVKEMTPIIARIKAAIDAGLDRPYLEGQSMWLGSAVGYFEREKLRPKISLPESDWMGTQTTAGTGQRLLIDPDKILLLTNGKTKPIVQSSNIYEGIISPDGKRVAFFRQTDENAKAEIWVVKLSNLKRKKVATLPSCATLLFSRDGSRIFIQEKTPSPHEESSVWSVSAGGGGLKRIAEARLLQTVAAKGRYEGSLILYKRTMHHLGTTVEECPYAFSQSGKEIGKIKDAACR